MARRRWGTRKNDDAGIALLLLAVGGIWTISRYPMAAAGIGCILGGMIVLITIARRRRHAGYRAALFATGVSDPMQLSPTDYEEFCAMLLARQGWTVQTTKVTGDYGADILARARGHVLVVQCKRYAKPVGVACVQQVHAARAYYSGDLGAVMATRGFTRAAEELADRTGIMLLVPGKSDLGGLARIARR